MRTILYSFSAQIFAECASPNDLSEVQGVSLSRPDTRAVQKVRRKGVGLKKTSWDWFKFLLGSGQFPTGPPNKIPLFSRMGRPFLTHP
jgi:hypothetical protein